MILALESPSKDAKKLQATIDLQLVSSSDQASLTLVSFIVFDTFEERFLGFQDELVSVSTPLLVNP